jgi:hypothetical protein
MIVVILKVTGIIWGMDNGSQAAWSSFFKNPKKHLKVPIELK